MRDPVLIIGGNSGIGFATTKRLQGNGVPLLAALRHPEAVRELGIETQAFDATSAPDLNLPEKLGGLVYFPGTINLKPFHRLSDGDFLDDLQTNFLGAVRAIRAALPALKKSDSASIVLFSTVAVAEGMPFHASIASAKAAVEGLARSLAAEFAPRIRVNVIAPSLTDTPLAGHLLGNDAKREAAEKRHPLDAVGSPDDVAELVAFLLSDASKFMTGQVLRPDGGLSTIRRF
ncbi:SDR family NAD(P)-dependent oxidoreductase [Haloferula sp. A504]|uniref:SDR family NAD(P)-dependent oxidoreductase n=1 Tax=Haloferula sp. A504 TaxID=3373601 RepID=UPI0031BF5FCA|nr:SDR family oxidoreductase [Verrucomicrobiaceae bacterium E54]